MYEQNINGIKLAWRARNVCLGMHVGAFVLADMFLFPLFVAGQRRGGEYTRCAGVVVCASVLLMRIGKELEVFRSENV